MPNYVTVTTLQIANAAAHEPPINVCKQSIELIITQVPECAR